MHQTHRVLPANRFLVFLFLCILLLWLILACCEVGNVAAKPLLLHCLPNCHLCSQQLEWIGFLLRTQFCQNGVWTPQHYMGTRVGMRDTKLRKAGSDVLIPHQIHVPPNKRSELSRPTLFSPIVTKESLENSPHLGCAGSLV